MQMTTQQAKEDLDTIREIAKRWGKSEDQSLIYLGSCFLTVTGLAASNRPDWVEEFASVCRRVAAHARDQLKVTPE